MVKKRLFAPKSDASPHPPLKEEGRAHGVSRRDARRSLIALGFSSGIWGRPPLQRFGRPRCAIGSNIHRSLSRIRDYHLRAPIAERLPFAFQMAEVAVQRNLCRIATIELMQAEHHRCENKPHPANVGPKGISGMSISEALTPIYLINLDRSTDRMRRFIERNEHINFTRVSAIDGGSLDREALIKTGYITSDLQYGSGTLGCAMSHIKLWEMAAKENRPITVFEDKIVVSKQFYERASEVMANLPPDWDFIQWGYWLGKNNLFIWVDFGTAKACIEAYGPDSWRLAEEQQSFQSRNCLVSTTKLLHSYGTFAYSISTDGARRALQHCLPLRERLVMFGESFNRRDNGIDVTLCSLYPQIKAYICLPQLVIPYGDGQSIRRQTDAEAATPPC